MTYLTEAEFQALAVVLDRYTEISQKTLSFTKSKSDEVERLRPGMGGELKLTMILTELAHFLDKQSELRAAINTDFESLSTKMMRDIRRTSEGKLPITGEEQQLLREQVAGIEMLLPIVIKAQTQYSRLKPTYSGLTQIQPDLTRSVRTAEKALEVVLANLQRFRLYLERELKVSRRKLNQKLDSE